MDSRILAKIYKAGLKLLIPLDLNETLEVITQEAMKIVKAEIGSIFLEQNGELKRVYSSSPVLESIIPRKRGYTYRVFKNKQPIFLNADIIKKIHPEITQLSARSDILIPLINNRKSIGVLTVMSSRKSKFSLKDLEVLTLFSPVASLAIRKSQLYADTKQALEKRDLFISMAAHELRTPLTTINGYVQLLKNKIPQNDSSESRWVYELFRESQRLTELVNELLVVDRIKSKELPYRFEHISIKVLVNRVISNFEIARPGRKIILKDLLGDKSDVVIGDFDKLMQAMTNLVENSIKFSDFSSDVTISLKRQDGYITVKVKDEGKGIPKQDLPKIFDGYYRADNHQVEGMGLGLYLVKNIIDAHRGDVEVKSVLNKGTTFLIYLPTPKNE